MNKRMMQILAGPIIMILATVLLQGALTLKGAQAVGVLMWTIYWWGARPVHIAVTGLVPVLVNALLSIVPMTSLTSQYVSSSIILVFGSGLLTMPWSKIGLDKRLALKTLSMIGPSMKSQITVWLLASIAISTVMPNVAVCALMTPIAVAMLKAAGYENIPKAAPAVPILLCIGWGAGLGGVGSPLGGAMNLVAIDLLQTHIGVEFMYFDWVLRIFPYLVFATLALLAFMLLMPMEVKSLDGTKDYFSNCYKELGPMKKEEKLCGSIFILALVGAFARPWYQEIMPSLEPAYVFLILGCTAFFITLDKKNPLISWEEAQTKTMWGMMILFGGGLALGSMINGSGASDALAGIVAGMNMDGGLATLIIFTIAARLIGELTNSTAAAAIIIPITLQFCTELGLNPIPYWFVLVMAYNAEYVLPISVRAIPVAYGLDANIMFKRGFVMTIFSMAVGVLVGWVCLQYWPTFNQLSNFVF